MTSSVQRLAERLAQLERNVRAGQSTPQLGTSSIENGGAIEDRYYGTVKQIFGRQFDGTHTTLAMNGPVPPQPNAPVLEAFDGGLTGTWDGLFEDDEDGNPQFAPADLARVDLHIVGDIDDYPLDLPSAGSIVAGTGGSVSVNLAPETYYGYLVAWTTAGSFAISERSEVVTVTSTLNPTSDGEPPATAPVVTGRPFAVGAVEYTWPAVTNSDRVEYDYWLSLTPTVDTSGPPDGFVAAPSVRVSRINDAALPMDGSSVYIKVRARDEDGPGPISAAAPATPREASVEQIIATFVAALEIEASQIRGQFISADLALLTQLAVGDRLDIDGNTSVITIYARELDSDGHRVPLITLDPDGSTFRGSIQADDISVLNGLILQGNMSQIANDAIVTLMNGVADPTIAPDLTVGWQTVKGGNNPTGFNTHGVCDHPTAGYMSKLIYDTSADEGRVLVINTATGTTVSSITLGNIPGMSEDLFAGIVYLGGYYYVGLSNFDEFNGEDYGYIVKFDATTGAYVHHTYLDVQFEEFGRDRTGRAIRLGIDYVSNKILWTLNGAGQSVHVINPTSLAWESYLSLGGANNYSRTDFIGRGNYDYGSAKWLGYFSEYLPGVVQAGTGASLMNDTNPGVFAVPATEGRMFWHATEQRFYFRTDAGTHYRLAPYTASEKVWAAHQWVAGANHTKISPKKSITVPARQYVTVQVPNYPAGITDADIYVGYGSTEPADAAMYKRTESLTVQRTMLLSQGHLTSGTPASVDAASNTFGAGGPAQLKSQTGGLILKGDGTLKAPKALQAGIKSVTPVANVETVTTVYFDTPFDAKPSVNLQPESGALLPFGGDTLKGWELNEVYADRFVFTILRGNTNPTTMHWQAFAVTQA